MMQALEFRSHGPEQTRKLGEILGKLAHAGDIFLLSGNLGSGKTCLTQGIASALGIKENVVSPSFMLVREYPGRLPLYHIDLYRLDKMEEIINLGLEEYFEGSGLCVVEWAEKGIHVFPGEHLVINISYLSQNERLFSFQPNGERYVGLLEEVKGKLDKWN